ncbi:nucleotidyltransferase family protein [Halegenticoccus tardaugens]|uniref:nucleotidyltransferase family protein n=1 Tax=Halegenticoccus tardaugens TaxID=2071624 RepID=UPI00100BD26D|nr:nucleotidyltransferase family protein [Halegenticoccus tardaugens]
MTERSLPVVEPLLPVDDVDLSGVVGVVLAAGTSSRFGETNKLLTTVDGTTLVRRATKTLLDAGLEVLVIVGHEAPTVSDAIDDLDVTIVENPTYEQGQSTSVRWSLGAATARGATAVVFLPGDMPFVEPSSVERLIAAYLDGEGEALAVAYEGNRGNPVLFGSACFDALRAVEGDIGGRSVLLDRDDSALVAVDDPGVRTDIDTQDALDAHR